MVIMEYEWDPKKANDNFKKHGVLFADAVTVFSDDRALTIEDIDHEEQRFMTLGLDAMGRVLVVVYAHRGETIRIISARQSTPREEKYYFEVGS
jgi:uncharacterized DUF497 family protein